eukprot:513387_1
MHALSVILLTLFWYNVLSEQGDCRNNFDCNDCLTDISCGWCSNLKVCVEGDSNGPYDGSCTDWDYNSCLTNKPSHDISWYAFGGNQEHNAYIPYTTKITEDSVTTVSFRYALPNTTGISMITAHDDIIYYWAGGNKEDNLSGDSYVYSQKLSNAEIEWSTYVGPNITYCSQPSLSTDMKYLMLLCYTKISSTVRNLTVLTLNPLNGKIIPGTNEFDIGSTNSNPLYSPLIASDINIFMMNYNSRQIGDYFINPYGRNWDQTLETTVGTYSSLVSGYNPYNKCFFSHTRIYNSQAHTNYGYLTVSQWMNGPVSTFTSGSGMRLSSTYPQKGVVVMYNELNMTFITGTNLCAISWDDRFPPVLKQEWCYSATSNSVAVPVIDKAEGMVYIYNGYSILSINITDGNLVSSYKAGNPGLKFNCNWNYGDSSIDGCLGVTPIVTQYNIFWTDGVDVVIFDKESGYVVKRINDICSHSQTNQNGMYLTWSNDNLIINCLDEIIAYSFK